MVDTDAIRARHPRLPRVFADAPTGDWVCDVCGEPWPCMVAELCDALDVLREENTRLRARVDEAEERVRLATRYDFHDLQYAVGWIAHRWCSWEEARVIESQGVKPIGLPPDGVPDTTKGETMHTETNLRPPFLDPGAGPSDDELRGRAAVLAAYQEFNPNNVDASPWLSFASGWAAAMRYMERYMEPQRG